MTATMVDLGAVIYAMVAVLVERGGVMVFWALEQRAEVARGMRAQGRAEGRAEGGPKDRPKDSSRRERLVRLAQEKGIDIAELLPKDEDRQ